MPLSVIISAILLAATLNVSSALPKASSTVRCVSTGSHVKSSGPEPCSSNVRAQNSSKSAGSSRSGA